MSTVVEFITDLQIEVKNTGNPDTATALRLAMVRALKRLSPMRTSFGESSFSFSTVAAQEIYDTSTSGFANNIQEIEHVEIDTGQGYFHEVRPVTIDFIRRMIGTTPVTTTYPDYYCWFANKMHLAYPPGSVLTVTVYYHQDAKRDSSTGALIGTTKASNAYTNVWFDEGQDALWCKTLQIYHATFAVDPERAAYYGSEWQEAAKALHSGWVRKAASGMRAEPYF
jgi:hypothetical protein